MSDPSMTGDLVERLKPVDWVKIARIAYWRRLGLIDPARNSLVTP